ncbi:MAG TPA: 2-phospho-L-lactate transferase [Acidimicrobiia bacterium]|nr:2-phospho-L-lactate transferase [Acidimicrobiia bacterium]
MIVGLGGGIGASRLWRAIAGAVPAEDLTCVVNTAEDLWDHGLRVCPDLDTVLYALSGRQDVERGWGVAGESFRCMDQLRSLGEDIWFNLGDVDLATHLFRTGRLRMGTSLSAVTGELATALGVRARVMPMTDADVRTVVVTAAGERLPYQEFLVRRGARDAVASFRYEGIEGARPAPGVLEAIAEADLVVIGPSNPVASIGPILEVAGVREALVATRAPVVAVTPVVTGVPVTDPGEAGRARSRAALLRAIGREHRAASVAELYRAVADAFVVDEADADEVDPIAAMGLAVLVAPTLAADVLADRLLDWKADKADLQPYQVVDTWMAGLHQGLASGSPSAGPADR